MIQKTTDTSCVNNYLLTLFGAINKLSEGFFEFKILPDTLFNYFRENFHNLHDFCHFEKRGT